MPFHRVTTETYYGPDIEIDCPACGQTCPNAATSEVTERAKMYWFFEIFSMHNTYVKCTLCGKGYAIAPSLEDLGNYTCEEISEMLRRSRASLTGTIFAILAVLCMGLPHVNYVVALIAMLINFRSRGWQKVLSVIMVLVSVSISLWVVFG